MTEGETVWFPDSAFPPLQPLTAVHEVVFVEAQVSSEESPSTMFAGDAEKESVGGGWATTVNSNESVLVSPPPSPVTVTV